MSDRTPEVPDDLVDTFMWQLVLDPDAYPRLARGFGERAAGILFQVASDYAAAMDGVAWLSPLRLRNAGD